MALPMDDQTVLIGELTAELEHSQAETAQWKERTETAIKMLQREQVRVEMLKAQLRSFLPPPVPEVKHRWPYPDRPKTWKNRVAEVVTIIGMIYLAFLLLSHHWERVRAIWDPPAQRDDVSEFPGFYPDNPKQYAPDRPGSSHE